MAWKLRQFFEGDKRLTVSSVAGTSVCWVDGGGAYVPNSIAIKVDGVETLLASVVSLSFGFLTVNMPTGKYIGPTTTIQVYAKCVTDVNLDTGVLTSKPVNFQVYNGPITACSNQITLTSDIDEYVRLYFTDGAATYSNIKINGTNALLSDFSYQSGDNGNIVASGGNFSRPSTFGAEASMVSNLLYPNVVTTDVTINGIGYHTVRLGYIELIFDGTTAYYNNYLVASENQITLGTYNIGDVFQIIANNNNYIAKKNGVVLFTKNKDISYTVTGGTVTPTSSQVGIAIAWNLPTTVGNYDLIANIGDSLTFKKTIQVHSCANAVNDSYTGALNTNYSGNVTTNDTICTGENTYIEIVPSTTVGGTVVLNQDGTFVFTPTTGFNGAASFQYRLRCGASFGASEIINNATTTINYFDPCLGVTANWIANGNVRCNNCVEQREEVDQNSACTGNNTSRWVTNVGGGACNRQQTIVATGVTSCVSCQSNKEVQDLNPCSPDYLSKNFIYDPTGTACDVIPVWVATGSFSCVDCTEKREERDTKTCSPTYNQTRIVNNPGGTSCTNVPTWVDINEFVCQNCVEYKKQQDTNSCSPTYNQKRNIINPNGTFCNTTPTWIDAGVTRCEAGVHQKLQTSSNPCSSLQERWVNTGQDELCSCLAQFSIKAICNPNDFIDNPIIGVTVHIKDVQEANRLISYSNNVITFNAELEEKVYVVKILKQDGFSPLTVMYKYKCNN